MYDISIQINPNDSDTYYKKGWIYSYFSGVALHSLRNLNEAIAMYDRAL